MHNKPLLSVIVPIYQVVEYVEKCVTSILKQSYGNLEIILIDDGSTDGCSEICDKLQEKDTRIKVIHKKNEGLVAARKSGVLVAHGEFITYVDGDDWIDSSMYTVMMEKIQKEECDIIASGRIEEFSDRSIVCKNRMPAGVYADANLHALYSEMLCSKNGDLFSVYPTVWDKIFRRDILLKAQMDIPNDIMVGEDVACTYVALLFAKKICILDNCFYHYNRRRNNSMLKKRDPNYFKRVQIIKDYLTEKFSTESSLYRLEEQLNAYLWDLSKNGLSKEYGINPTEKIGARYLFPFNKIVKGARIVLYGAGQIGREFYRQLSHSNYCELIAWVDQAPNYWTVEKIDILKDLKYDNVVLALGRKYDLNDISNKLITLYNVPKESIVFEDYVIK